MRSKQDIDNAFRRLKELYEISAPKPVIEFMLIGFIRAYFGSLWKFFKIVLWHKYLDFKSWLL